MQNSGSLLLASTGIEAEALHERAALLQEHDIKAQVTIRRCFSSGRPVVQKALSPILTGGSYLANVWASEVVMM